jgi:hypothetical protein
MVLECRCCANSVRLKPCALKLWLCEIVRPSQNVSFRDVQTEHRQLAVNARRTPCRVLCDHAEDQVLQFLANPRSSPAHSMSRQPCPIKLESGSMPSDHSLRLNRQKRLFPSRPEPAQEHPKESVTRTESRPRTPPLQYDKLLPQSQISKSNSRREPNSQPTRRVPSRRIIPSVFHVGRAPRHMIHVLDSWADRHLASHKTNSYTADCGTPPASVFKCMCCDKFPATALWPVPNDQSHIDR